MPDYAKTQIYKIVSKDSNITNFYIGSTTNWTKRKQNHKVSCNNENDKKYNLQIYQIIRSNGGFENFNMILVEDYPCENRRQVEQREQHWKDLLKPDMNMVNCANYEFNKYKNPKEYNKEIYEKNKETMKEYRRNNKDKLREYKKEYYQINKETILENKKQIYICEHCNKKLSLRHKSTHEKTLKHINNINLTKST